MHELIFNYDNFTNNLTLLIMSPKKNKEIDLSVYVTIKYRYI